MDPSSARLLLPVEAQKRFERVADENRLLKQQLDSQKAVISDVSGSIADTEAIEKDLQSVTDQLAAVDQRLAGASAILLEHLSTSANAPPAGRAGELLKQLLSKIQLCISDLAIHGVGQGSMSVSVISLIELGEQIRKIIEDLHEKGLYPETPEAAEERLASTHQHTASVLKFLQDFAKSHESDG
jgi:hypothetical protein